MITIGRGEMPCVSSILGRSRAVLSSCAGGTRSRSQRSRNRAPFDCTMIRAEINANNEKAPQLANEQGMKAAQNVAAGGGGRAPSRRHGRHSPRSAAQPRASRQVCLGTQVVPARRCLTFAGASAWPSAAALRPAAASGIVVRVPRRVFVFLLINGPLRYDAQHQSHPSRPSP
jgi:hypothetical protein